MRMKLAAPALAISLCLAAWPTASAAIATDDLPQQIQPKASFFHLAQGRLKLRGPGAKLLKVKPAKKSAGLGFSSFGGPPPWAPANGYRRNFGGGNGGYTPPFGIGSGSCNGTLLGTLLGAAAGGLLGAQIGKGDGQLAAVAGGTLLGALVGGSIGKSMNRLDQSCVGQALEHAPDGQSIAWNAQEGGTQYQVTPVNSYQQTDGRYCREYQTTAVVNGQAQDVYGTACRQPDGAWQIID